MRQHTILGNLRVWNFSNSSWRITQIHLKFGWLNLKTCDVKLQSFWVFTERSCRDEVDNLHVSPWNMKPFLRSCGPHQIYNNICWCAERRHHGRCVTPCQTGSGNNASDIQLLCAVSNRREDWKRNWNETTTVILPESCGSARACSMLLIILFFIC